MNEHSKDRQPKPEKITYILTDKAPGGRLVVKAKVMTDGERVELTPADLKMANVKRWVSLGWLREATDEEKSAPLPARPAAKTNGAPILQAVLGESPMQPQAVPLERIRPDPSQPRKVFTEEAMSEMVQSIKQHGVQQAILVRPMSRWRQIVGFVARQWARRERKEEGFGVSSAIMRKEGIDVTPMEEFGAAWMERLVAEGRVEKDWQDNPFVPAVGALAPLTGETTMPGEEEWLEIVYGERRWRGSQLAGMTTIPAKVEELSDVVAAERQYAENMDRDDLKPLEEAAQYQKLLNLPGYGMARLIETTGRARNTIYGKLQLLKLPEEARTAVERGELPAVTAERLGRLEGRVQAAAVKHILHAHPTLRDGKKAPPDRECRRIIDQVQEEEAKLLKEEGWKADALKRGLRWFDEKEREKIYQHGGYPTAASGWIQLDQRVQGDPECRSYNQVLAQKPGKVAAKAIKPEAANIRYGTVVELYNAQRVHMALEAAGVKFGKREKPVNKEEARRRERHKRLKTVLDQAARIIQLKAQAFVSGAGQTSETLEMWRALARCAVTRASNDDQRAFVKRRGLTPHLDHYTKGDKGHPNFEKTILAFLADKGHRDLAGIVSELMLTSSAQLSSWSTDFNEGFKSGAEAFGVDLKRLKLEQGDDAAGVEGAKASAGARTEPELESAQA